MFGFFLVPIIPHIYCLGTSLHWLNLKLLGFYILSVILDPTMDRSQSLNAPPFFDGSNYTFWKVHICAFLCSINESVWVADENGWTKLEAAKSTWDKAALTTPNANSKALNVFCGVSPNEFHRISHVTIAKEAWEILRTTYKGTKKVKDTKLQMLPLASKS